MATIQQAYFASKPLGNLRVHEGNDDASISIDLYNFEGDGKDVCDNLEFDFANGDTIHLKAFAICYDPDRKRLPVTISCNDLTNDGYAYLSVNDIPDITLASITTWLWDIVKQPEERSVWLRLGVTVRGTKEQIEALFEGDGETLRRLIECKQFTIDGNSYIPEPDVDDYNQTYHTDHEGDVEISL